MKGERIGNLWLARKCEALVVLEAKTASVMVAALSICVP